MSNIMYPAYKAGLLKKLGDTYDLSSGSVNVKAILVDTAVYTYSAAHQFYSSVSGTVGTATALANKTVSSTGVFDADDLTFSSVTNTGLTYEALILFVDTGNPSTSPLLAYIDTATSGLPVTPNGGDVVVQWNASGIL